MQWYRIDLHLHTPGSEDYQEPNATYLDILRRAEVRGLDIIAFTDHNTVKGYDRMTQEIQQLEMLVRLDRAQPEEKRRLAEYRRLLDKILVLPGFEFTATFGFHILGIFPPTMRVRQIEHILLTLNIPSIVLEEGNSNVGASSDVLTAYREINNAGGLVIAAHVNSAHGVAMRGFDFGGQTKIAYTQDPHLHCLEVTDLERRGRGTTASFFSGTKPEYPRQMRCIQGSDAHRLTKDAKNDKNLGVGERTTEVLLPEKSFQALYDLFRGNDFARSRPYRGPGKDFYDHVHIAREAGPNIVQSFYDSYEQRTGKLYGIVADTCAFANTNGGTIYVGAASDIMIPVTGVDRISECIETLRDEIGHKIMPPIEVEIDMLETNNKQVVRVRVPRGTEPPYVVDENRIYVREEAETVLAVRDEIVRLVQRVPSATAVSQSNMQPQGQPRQDNRQSDQRQRQGRDQGQNRRQNDRSQNQQGRQSDNRGRQQGRPQYQAATPSTPVSLVADTPLEVVEALPVELPPVHIVPDEQLEAPISVETPPVETVEAPAPVKKGRGRRGTKTQQVEQAAVELPQPTSSEQPAAELPPVIAEPLPTQPMQPIKVEPGTISAPRTGVEIIGTETRKGEQYHVMRDLRNGNIVKNVTRQSARRLWHYAIMERENNPVESSRVQWAGIIGLWKRYKRGDVIRYDLVMRDNGAPMRTFYGVTEDGMHGAWQQFVSDAEPEIVVADEG